MVGQLYWWPPGTGCHVLMILGRCERQAVCTPHGMYVGTVQLGCSRAESTCATCAAPSMQLWALGVNGVSGVRGGGGAEWLGVRRAAWAPWRDARFFFHALQTPLFNIGVSCFDRPPLHAECREDPTPTRKHHKRGRRGTQSPAAAQCPRSSATEGNGAPPPV